MIEERKTRTRTEITNRRQEVARLYLRGMYQTDIAVELSVDQATVSRDLAELRKEWLQSALVDLNEAKAKELAKIDQLEVTCWAAWERSKENAEVETVEQIGVKSKTAKKGDKEEFTITPERIKKNKRVEGQSGNPSFLAGIQWCINKRCEILGLDAAKRNLTFDVTKCSDAQLERIARGEDVFTVLSTASAG
jgi:predicted transcriptional regulator